MDKINKISTISQSSSDYGQHEGSHVIEALKKDVQILKEKISDFKDKASDKASETQETVAKYVKENPLKSLGWAALTGVALGVLLRK